MSWPITAGDLFSAALESDGSVWTWGRNTFGQLGIGSTVSQDVPQKVALPAPAKQVYDATRVARASPSTSSATTRSGLPDWATFSSRGISSRRLLIFFS